VQKLNTASDKALKEAKDAYQEKIRLMDVGHRASQHETHTMYSSKLRKMELEMVQFRTGVDMLITIIETEFDDNQNYLNMIEKIKLLIHPIGDDAELRN
jgi:hypothetical protein